MAKFDYGILDVETAKTVEKRAGEIKGLIKRTAKNIIEIGKKLNEVKQLTPHGVFGAWLATEFDLAFSTAQRFMRVAERFKSVNLTDLNFAPSALYVLAAPSTPESAREEAIDRAQVGEVITHGKAKAIVATHKQNPRDHFSILSQSEPRGRNLP